MKSSNSGGEKKKIVVAGWTDYDNEYYSDCEITDEVFDAVVQEVREKGYLFGGNSHQDYSACCPVMSNGCCARFSWRGWGAVIAKAYERRGANGKLDHLSGYMDDMINPASMRRPDAHVNFNLIEDNGKTYRLTASPTQYDNDMFKRFEARADTDDVKDVQVDDYLDMRVCDEDGIPFPMETYRVKAVYRGSSFEELLDEAEKRYDVDAERFGYPDGLTREQLIEQLYADYPRGQIREHGAVVFRTVPYRK